MGDERQEIVLLGDSGPTVRTHLRAWIAENGLILEGQDLGTAVASMLGDSDYEYWLSVDREHFDRLITELGEKLGQGPEQGDDQEMRDRRLLELIELAWKTDVFETDVDFRRWLDSNGIPSKFDSYT